ncbi:MAG: VTT domain-containing protein [Acidobacteriaceae bacterium]
MTPFSSHQYIFLFVWTFAEQVGLPFPALPVLLATGAVAHAGGVSFTLAILLAVAASAIPDTGWYLLGKYKGARVLNLLCRLSIEPDLCVTKTRLAYQKRASLAVLTARFIPGVGVLTPPLAGVLGMPYLKFLGLDLAGALLWATSYIFLGALFHAEIDRALLILHKLGASFLAAALVIAIAYAFYKWNQRRRLLRDIRIARIDPLELSQRIQQGDDLLIVDLRSEIDFLANPVMIAGALRMSPSELAARHQEISRHAEIALYCT